MTLHYCHPQHVDVQELVDRSMSKVTQLGCDGAARMYTPPFWEGRGLNPRIQTDGPQEGTIKGPKGLKQRLRSAQTDSKGWIWEGRLRRLEKAETAKTE